MTDERILIKAFLVSETGYVPCHFFISHAFVMLGLSMVAQIDQKYVSRPRDSVIQCEVAPHAPLAKKSMQEQNRIARCSIFFLLSADIFET